MSDQKQARIAAVQRAMVGALSSSDPKGVLEDSALDRIIAAPRLAHRLDRDALRDDIIYCYSKYSILSVGPGRVDFVERQVDLLRSARKHARKLAELLKKDEVDMRVIWGKCPIGSGLLPELLLLAEWIDAIPELKEKPRDVVNRTKKSLSTTGGDLETLTGALLPEVFTRHFGITVGTSRDSDGDPTGPYIRFASQVLIELGIRCSRETVVRAVRQGKK